MLAATALSGVQINRRVIRSRTVTQEQIAAGWEASGIELVEHTIRKKENFWKVAKEYGVDIDSIVGANPGLGKLSASLGQTIRVPNQKGVLHRTEEQENVQTIAELYNVPAESITSMNNLGPKPSSRLVSNCLFPMRSR
jgi:hypothetical protein